MSTLYALSTNPKLADQSFRAAKCAERYIAAESNTAKRQTASSPLAWGYGMAMVFLLGVGTGGAVTPQFLSQREAKYPLKEFKEPPKNFKVDTTLTKLAPRNAAEALSHIRSVLKPAVTELASIFGVSRQAIYNWQSGEHISEANQSLLFELASAADVILAHPMADRINAKRKLPGGKTLLQTVADGTPGSKAANLLISMVEAEGAQRAAIEEKLKNRDRTTVEMETVGSPHLYEKV